jgi:hypothetical protein
MRGLITLIAPLICLNIQAAPLNSDAIRDRYGSYSVDVIAQSSTQRVAALRSGFEPNVICRTLAFTQFKTPVAKELQQIHNQILDGSSIGETIRKNGFEVIKRDQKYFQITSGNLFDRLSRNTVPKGALLLAQIYRISASSTSSEHPYAVIIEIYHPDYRPPLESTASIESLKEWNPEYRNAIQTLELRWREAY